MHKSLQKPSIFPFPRCPQPEYTRMYFLISIKLGIISRAAGAKIFRSTAVALEFPCWNDAILPPQPHKDPKPDTVIKHVGPYLQRFLPKISLSPAICQRPAPPGTNYLHETLTPAIYHFLQQILLTPALWTRLVATLANLRTELPK